MNVYYYILSEKYDSKFSLNIMLKNKNRALSHAGSVNVDTKIYSIGPYIVHDYQSSCDEGGFEFSDRADVTPQPT